MLKNALHTFIQVCRSGSFTKAAAALYITPSAVMQQIDQLEREYGVTLLTRSHHGVTPTEAGSYLLTEAEVMRTRAGEVRARLKEIAAEGEIVCVGTSLLERCRLLYDLWTLYSQERPASRIQMVNVGVDTGVPACADLLESVRSSVHWMREWDFFEICRVPFGIALEPTHPLAARPVLEPEDLNGQTVVAFRNTDEGDLHQVYEALERHGARLHWEDAPTPSVFWECAFRHRLLLAPMCWSDILAGLTLRRVRWPYALPYGIFSRPRPRDEVARFLRFIHKTYNGHDPNDIVPVLTY